MSLTNEQLDRYARHLILKGFGMEAQKKLLASSVLIIGAGGLGSPAAMYLAAAGVGHIGLADGDVVDVSNLQRQIIHTTADVGKPKVLSAKETIEALNPDVKVTVYEDFLGTNNILDVVKQYDFVVEATDSHAAKFLVNDACVLAGVPCCIAGVLRFEGQITTVVPGSSHCFRCAFREPPPPGLVPTCREAGILGVVPGIMGTYEALEAIKYLTGTGELLTEKMLYVDLLTNDIRTVIIPKDPECPVCGEHPSITELKDENYVQQACPDDGDEED